ncbi:heavy metal translocatin [Cenococcum geophilum 1.58]|uniref:heavy metal translocatin n=1 Tax=Cenococcum geophilum 1.58 TaxID=794803 RepID=UPI00358F554C|nr:heavy metal translocatin [Cenococcum geophilum 1.58]
MCRTKPTNSCCHGNHVNLSGHFSFLTNWLHTRSGSGGLHHTGKNDSTDSCCHDPRDNSDKQEKGSNHSLEETENVTCVNLTAETEPIPEAGDLERGLPTIEQVILSVGGMTCSGCEQKLIRALDEIQFISDYKTSLVRARAGFNLDASRLSAEDAISKLKRLTGYSFERIEEEDGQILEVLVDNPVTFCNRPRPHGVRSLETAIKVNSKMVRIQYDASQVGPRDLLERGFTEPLELAPHRVHPEIAAGARQSRKAGILFLFAMTLTMPVLIFAWAPIPGPKLVYNSVSLGLATIIQLVVAKEFYPSTYTALFRSGPMEMDFLIALSSSTAYIFSVVAFAYIVNGHPLSTGSFFETSTLLVTLILLGRFVSELARQIAARSVSFRSIQEHKALLIIGDRGTTKEIDSCLLQRGDIFKVPPHSRIVTDGKVVLGGSEVDESMVTGEPIPVVKGLGHTVIAGSLNGNGELQVALTALPFENSISKIASLVEDVELSRPRVQALADRVASYFVPAIIAITLIVFAVWILIGVFVRRQSRGEATVQALTYAVATLIVSCPCAIGLAVPMVVLIAGGVSAQHGIVFRDPQKIETARNATHVVFDKTGTLTKGEMSVVHAEYQGDSQETKALLLGLVSDISHPVSIAITKHLKKERGLEPVKLRDITSIPGKGVEGRFQQRVIRAGNSDWLHVENLEPVEAQLQTQHSVFCVTIDGKLHALFRLQDPVRDDAAEVVSQLMSRGISVSMISGDDDGPVQNIAHIVNIPRKKTRSRCTPAAKQDYVHKIQKQGDVVIFCGDGTNDAVALTQADVGVHMSQGCDVARGAADVILTSSKLYGIPIMIDISRASYRRIMFNFAWAALYNVGAVLLAAGAFVNVRIPPAFAGLGEIVSVLPVVLIAFWLKYKDFTGKFRPKRT